MRFTDYFAGQEVRLRSPLPAGTVAERINAAAIFGFPPFRTGIIGRAWWGRVRLRYRSSLFEYNGKPILAGRILDASPGSELRLRYRAPAWAYVFFPIWYLFIAIFALVIPLAGPESGITSGTKAILAAILVTFFFVPPILHAIGTRRSEEELEALTAFLREHGEAEPDPR